MGLLDNFSDALTSDQGLLGLALMASGAPRAGGRTSLGEGLLGAAQMMAAQKLAREEQAMKRQMQQAQIGLLGAQLKETEAQAAERLANAQKRDMVQGLLKKLQGGGQSNQYGIEGQGMTLGGVREQMTPQPGGVRGLTPEDLVAFKANGIDIADIWKTAQTGVEMKPGSFYVQNGRREYAPDVKSGLDYKNGRASLIPNFAESQAALTGATEGAKAAATAPWELTQQWNPSRQAMEIVSKAEALGRAGPQQMPQMPQMPAAGLQGPSSGSPIVDAAIAQRQQAVQQATSDLQQWAAGVASKRGQPAPQAGGRPQAGPSAAEKWSPMPERGLMRNDLGETRPMTGQDGKPIGSPQQASEATGNDKFLEAAKQARALLTAGATSSGVGTLVDSAGAMFGIAPKGSVNAEKLRALGGWMTSNVPRMEGPQSNFDQMLYREMAGIVGDSTKPIDMRLGALDTVETIIKRYQGMNPAAKSQEQPAAQSMGSLQEMARQELERRRRGGATGGW